MKIIPTWLHGAFDYICGFALILSPDVLGVVDPYSPERIVPQIIGLLILVQSLMTRYECGVLRLLPMTTHRFNEALAALFLSLSPWVFDFSSAEILFVCSGIGVAMLLACLLTSDQPRQVLRPAI